MNINIMLKENMLEKYMMKYGEIDLDYNVNSSNEIDTSDSDNDI